MLAITYIEFHYSWHVFIGTKITGGWRWQQIVTYIIIKVIVVVVVSAEICDYNITHIKYPGGNYDTSDDETRTDQRHS